MLSSGFWWDSCDFASMLFYELIYCALSHDFHMFDLLTYVCWSNASFIEVYSENLVKVCAFMITLVAKLYELVIQSIGLTFGLVKVLNLIIDCIPFSSYKSILYNVYVSNGYSCRIGVLLVPCNASLYCWWSIHTFMLRRWLRASLNYHTNKEEHRWYHASWSL